MQNSRELDRVIHSDFAQFCVRNRPGISPETKDCRILTCKHLGKRGAGGDIRMESLSQFWMGNDAVAAHDGSPPANASILESVAKCISANHSSRTHQHKTRLTRRRHESALSSSQST